MSSDVRDYYEGNTRAFLRPHRRGAATGTIHRALWAPGVSSRWDALHYIHHCILAELKHTPTLPADTTFRGLDLGCGVGASLAWIASQHPGSYHGLTVSPVQRDIARATLPETCTVHAGDATNPADLTAIAGNHPFHAVWMIESFNHIAAAADLLAGISRHLAPGGLLLICDDFLTRPPETDAQRRMVDQFRSGWHMHGLTTAAALQEQSAAHGLTPLPNRTTNLSPYIRHHGIIPTLVRLTATLGTAVGASSPWWDNIIGGNALNQLGYQGLIQYQLLVFQRSPVVAD